MATVLLNPLLKDAPWRVWWIEKEGQVYARLEEARFLDMFWVLYRVVDLTTTEQARTELYSMKFWHEGPLPTFRHVETGVAVDSAFAGRQTPTAEHPLVSLRSLYPPPVTRARRPFPETDATTHLLRRFCLWIERVFGSGAKPT